MSHDAADVFGLLAQFDSAATTAAAARQLSTAGFKRWDIYGPAPLEELDELVPPGQSRLLTAIMVAAGLLGAALVYLLQDWSAVHGYPINVGGRPDHGWPGFIPSTWEFCALFTVWGGLIAFLVCRRLPRLHHPLFAAPGFERASQDRYFICVERVDPAYDVERLREIFQYHAALEVAELPQLPEFS